MSGCMVTLVGNDIHHWWRCTNTEEHHLVHLYTDPHRVGAPIETVDSLNYRQSSPLRAWLEKNPGVHVYVPTEETKIVYVKEPILYSPTYSADPTWRGILR